MKINTSEANLNVRRVARLAEGRIADPGPDVNVPVPRNSPWLANRPPDAALSPVDVAQLGRIQAVVDERNDLQKQVHSLHLYAQTLLDREGVREVALIAKLRDEERATRRACYLAAALFIALVWREGYAVGMWLWRLL